MSILNLFPARIRFVNADGTLTAEASRMLEVLVQRGGGTLGDVGADVFALAGAQDDAADVDAVLQQAAPIDGPGSPVMQPQQVEPPPHEMLMQPLPQQINADQVDGLGTMATQNIGTNFTGSFTGKTVTVTNGIITSVI
jgi:hypothetical protein